MSCKQCGHALSHLTAVLAQTEIGTQCPKCWATLRSVHVNHTFRGKEATQQFEHDRLRLVQSETIVGTIPQY